MDQHTTPLPTPGVKVMYVHRDDLARFGMSPAGLDEFDELLKHVRGRGDGQTVHDGFATYQSTMAGSCNGFQTAFQTSFTTTDNSLVAPVAHAAWLTRFNGLAGDVAGRLTRALLNPDYVNMLDTRADLTNPPCPGQTPNLNRFVTSIQVMHSTPTMPVRGRAGDALPDRSDEPFSFTIAVNASVVRAGTSLNFVLFPALAVAVPVRPGGIMIFAGMEERRAMPMVRAAHDSSPIPLNYPEETRLEIVMYPQQGILNGRLERSLPTTPAERASRYNLINHGLVAFGSAVARDLWSTREALRRLVNDLQKMGVPGPIDLLSVADTIPWSHPGPRPDLYRHLEVVNTAARRSKFVATLLEQLRVLRRASASHGPQPVRGTTDASTDEADLTADTIDYVG
ncbi:MAG: hypothetical protein M1826_005134 [Phylliscum demangeonii]|nr:MAG: hypothetical protein M1826_005134 [Phylliscum demangeonii]